MKPTSSLFAERLSVEQVELGDELTPRFDASGLLPAIVVDAASGQILMLGQMNAEALERTITTRQAHFWSRSRNACGARASTAASPRQSNVWQSTMIRVP